MNYKYFSSLLIILGFVFSQVQATTYENCFTQSAEKHNVPLNILLAISFTESSFNPKSRNKNKNGTSDYGLMQINSLWAKEAKKMGYSWNQIKSNPCTNIMFGGLILKNNHRRLGHWQGAVGAYNAGFSKKPKAKRIRARYYAKVMANKAKAKHYLSRLRREV